MVFYTDLEKKDIMQYKIILLALIISNLGFSQLKHPLESLDKDAQKIWVDATYDAMTLEEKIGQLFIADVWSGKGKLHTDKIKTLITRKSYWWSDVF